jgi:hypothetical protein
VDFFHWDFSLVGEEGESLVFTCLKGATICQFLVLSMEHSLLGF